MSEDARTPGPKGRAADARNAWIIGGGLLVAAAVLPLAWFATGPSPVPRFDVLLMPAALILFAFGIRGAGSVTDRRPLGTGALVGLAAWTVAYAAVSAWVLGPVTTADQLTGGSDGTLAWLQIFGWADRIVRFALALIAVVQIGRIGVVSRPWNWAPAWTLGAVVAVEVLSLLVFLGGGEIGASAVLLLILQSFVGVFAPLFLGILAIVLSTRVPRTVRVFP